MCPRVCSCVYIDCVCIILTSLLTFVTPPAPVFHTLPPGASSKTKGPNITQPVYATSTRATTGPLTTTTTDSVYSLAAKADYESLQRNLTGATSSAEPVSSRGLGTNRASTLGRESVAENNLSEMAYFSPRPGEGLGFLAESDPVVDGTTARYGTAPRHRAVDKSKSATLAATALPDTPSGLEHRCQTAFSGSHHQPHEKLHISNSSTILTGTVTPLSAGLPQLQESPFDSPAAALDRESAAREEGYGVLHMPPPINRSKKPPQQSPTSSPRSRPPVNHRDLKLDRLKEVESDSSESSEEGGPVLPAGHRWADPTLPPYTKLTEEDSVGVVGREERAKEEQETQFTVAEIPRVTVRTTQYTQVDFNPDTRRPVPLPRKTSKVSSLAPRPSQRTNYTDVDIQATNDLSDHLQRQMTVRGAERKALSEKHYVNVDHSGIVDDETDPDYYTYMRVSPIAQYTVYILQC